MNKAILLAVAILAAAPLARADKVVLKDGRVIEGTLRDVDEQGRTVLEIRGKAIPIEDALIERTFVENLEGYVPQSKKEEEYLKKGYVLFEGSWMSKTRREGVLKDRKAEADAEIKQLKSDQRWSNRKKFDTRYFHVESNLPPEILDEWVTSLETYYKEFRDFWGIKISPKLAKTKMKVFLYRTPNDFHEQTGTARNIGGFFNWGYGELHIPYDKLDPPRSVAVLFHEFNHLLTYLIEPDFMYPIWMNEGMAEYYGTAAIEGDDFIVGRQQDGRLCTIFKDQKEGDLMDLETLLMTDRGPFNATHYAYAWSFCHFLMQSDEYSKKFRGFFGNLPSNRDIPTKKGYFDRDGKLTKDMCQLSDVIVALEKRLGKSVAQLDAEWKSWMEQAYTELNPRAYYLAARLELMDPKDDDSHVTAAQEFFEKAVSLGVDNAECYRAYAEMVRKGGVDHGRGKLSKTMEPDPDKALMLIDRAIELDPVNPQLYLERGGILIMESDFVDPDEALGMAEIAVALDHKSPEVKSLHDELVTAIEDARNTLRDRIEREAALAAADNREWWIQPAYTEGEEVPDQITGLTTAELHELVRDGTIGAGDWIYQAYRAEDPETGEMVAGPEPWDQDWVALKDIPIFADDLEAAG